MKIIAVLFFLFIVYSLASALYYMIKDGGKGTRMIRSLTLRIGLSVILFVILMAGYYFNLLPADQ
ncbi:MAG: twin transmembrane helix small protein [Kordiimonadaceae bacterium]|nr:twin transmembrane helix small protein [Kordiimonadaceae bacterium]